jgi:hypothetical protein
MIDNLGGISMNFGQSDPWPNMSKNLPSSFPNQSSL